MELNLFNLFIWSVCLLAVLELSRKLKRKTVWVIEDDENEALTLKLKLAHADKIHFVFKKNLKEISFFDLLFRSPDGVIADYILEGSHKGDELVNYCKRNGIPAVLVTGYEAEIFGKSKPIIKQQGGEHIAAINAWVERKVLA